MVVVKGKYRNKFQIEQLPFKLLLFFEYHTAFIRHLISVYR